MTAAALTALTAYYTNQQVVSGVPSRWIADKLGVKTPKARRILKALEKKGVVVGVILDNVIMWHIPSDELTQYRTAVDAIKAVVDAAEDQEAACRTILAMVETFQSELSGPYAKSIMSVALAWIPLNWTSRIGHCHKCQTYHINVAACFGL